MAESVLHFWKQELAGRILELDKQVHPVPRQAPAHRVAARTRLGPRLAKIHNVRRRCLSQEGVDSPAGWD